MPVLKLFFKGSILCLAISLYAKPHGAKVVSGDASITSTPESCLIESGKKTIIQWDGFSIDPTETVNFQQFDPSSAVLNRVIGGSSSALLGTLLSNGKVYIINPNGVLIGPNSRVETAGLIASTLDVLDADFLEKNSLLFSGSSLGLISNLGTIVCPTGNVALISRQVTNQGSITAPEGTVSLISAVEVLLKLEGDQQIFIRPSFNDADSIEGTALDHSGSIQALAVELRSGVSPYTKAIHSSGTIQATNIEEQGGRIYLIAEQGISELSGELIATNSIGKGGNVRILGTDVHLLDNASIDVSGQTGGGEVLIGGDYQGANPDIMNAQHTWASPNTQVKADALENGDGGKVIFWGDEATFHYGKINALGGQSSGDGGFVEVSGTYLDFQAMVDTRAPFGQAGSLLLDPTNVTISTAVDSANSFSGGSYTFSASPSNINTGTLVTNLGMGAVLINTAGGLSGTGTITVSSPITWTSNNTLTMVATSFISIGATIANTSPTAGFTAMNFTAAGPIGTLTNPGILVSSSLTTSAGGITLTGSSAATGSGSHGVSITAAVTTTTSGPVVVIGSTGVSSAVNHGVSLSGTGNITTGTGNVQVSGITNSTVAANGVNLSTAAGNPITSASGGIQVCGLRLELSLL